MIKAGVGGCEGQSIMVDRGIEVWMRGSEDRG